MPTRLKLLSANIQAGTSTRRYSDYATRSWSHVLPAGGKRDALDAIARLAREHDIVGLQESDPGSWRSGFTNQTHYLAERGGFDFWAHQPNRRVGTLASSASLTGSSLHTGEDVTLTIHPAPAGHGFKFRRVDLPDEPTIDAHVSNVKTVERATTIVQVSDRG